jgi:flavin reductase (DIM6/NTAB) family NADH-FMN oxidoreductase RutF
VSGPEPFEDVVGRLDYPMFIVTAAAGAERDGCLVGFASQCSIDPARFVVWLSDKNRTYRVAREAQTLAVHVVPAGRRDLAELFGGTTGDTADKLGRCAWHPGPGGAPVLDDCPEWFAGRVLEQVRGGDHVGFVLEPVGGDGDGGEALTFQRTRDIAPGHEA